MISFKKFLKENKDDGFEHQELVKHYDGIIFNSLHRHSIKNYTKDSSDLNNHLWEEHKKPIKSVYNSLNNVAEELNKTLHSYKTPHKLEVWSSSKIDPREKMDDKKIVHHPAFLSASIDKAIAEGRNTFNTQVKENGDIHHNILKMNIPKDHPGVYVDHVSHMHGEKEFILPKGTNLKYKKTDTHEKDYYNHVLGKSVKSYTHIHHMSIEPNE
jgi:hypothetical protein